MKKILFTAAALLTLAYAHAQYIGLKGGLNLSNLYIDEVDDESMRTGYHFGGYLHLPISDGFAVQPELLYSTKGSAADYNVDLGPFGTVNGTGKFNLNYIDVPVLAVFKIGDVAEIHAGPYFGFLVNSNFEFEGDYEDEGEFDTDNFKALDYGLSGGLAINLGPLQVGARYNYGLQEVQDSDLAEAFLGSAKNSYAQLFGALRIGDYE